MKLAVLSVDALVIKPGGVTTEVLLVRLVVEPASCACVLAMVPSTCQPAITLLPRRKL